MDVLCIAAAIKISHWPRLISYQKAACPTDPENFHDFSSGRSVTAGRTAVAKAAFSIRRAACRANGIRQFYLEAGAGPPVILLHGFPETSFAWRFQIPALAPEMMRVKSALEAKGTRGTQSYLLPGASMI
jgi:hypothetical protein